MERRFSEQDQQGGDLSTSESFALCQNRGAFVRDQREQVQSRRIIELAAAQHLPIRADPTERPVEELFQPGAQVAINITGREALQDVMHGIIGWEMRTAGTERPPQDAPVLLRPDPGAVQTVAPLQLPQQDQDPRQGIAASFALARIGTRAQAAEQTIGMSDQGHGALPCYSQLLQRSIT
jgi:hypothetical protein